MVVVRSGADDIVEDDRHAGDFGPPVDDRFEVGKHGLSVGGDRVTGFLGRRFEEVDDCRRLAGVDCLDGSCEGVVVTGEASDLNVVAVDLLVECCCDVFGPVEALVLEGDPHGDHDIIA